MMLCNPEQTKKEMIDWVRDYFEANGKDCYAVIGLSGGKDSSVAAAICAQALGPDRVVGVLMPNGIQPDIADAEKLVDILKIQSIKIDISEVVNASEKVITSSKEYATVCRNNQLSNDAKINLPARVRMTTLYAVAQSLSKGGRVVNTCNRSEDYVGYSTKYGDMAGDFSLFANLLVQEVRQLGIALGLPKELVYKTPADGLSGCTDEEKLGFSYEMLDEYLVSGHCEDAAIEEKIKYLHQINLHKLQPMPAFPN